MPLTSSRSVVRLLWLCVALATAAGDTSCHANDGALAKQARALISDRCFACHGPDSGNREADLRLDEAEAFLDPDRGIVVPGDPDASELIRRALSPDEYERMPPPDAHLTLSDAEKDLLVRWVEAGAPWADHWAFVPPVAKATPADAHPVDTLIAAKLDRLALSPTPLADRPTLLRRVTLDLTGLPPTLDELDRFQADEGPDAFERVVDRLLASPRFGERMAIDWLDAARYADTYGYQSDRFRRVWPWRDWVVRAINANLPYDDFLTWQLAGDLLPDATRDQRLATTFNRLHRETNEGGSLPEEFRAENVADRVNTVGAAVLGLTLECARCHDHKFDPISQRDYYSLAAYFNNTGELGLYSHFTDAIPTPALNLPTDQQADRLATARADVAALEAQFGDRAEGPGAALRSLPDPPEPAARYSFDSLSDDEKLVGAPERVEGVRGEALLLDGENGWVGPRHAMERSRPFSLSVWLRPSIDRQSAIVIHRSQAWLDAAGRGYQIALDEGRPWVALVHFWPGDALAVRAPAALPVDAWTHVAFTYDGSSKASGLKLYVAGEPVEGQTLADSLTRAIRFIPGDGASDNQIKLSIGHRFRDTGFKGGAVDELAVYHTELTAPEVRRLAGGSVEEATPAEWAEHWRRREDTKWAEFAAALQAARAERDAATDSIPQIPVMADLPQREPSYLLERGAYDAPGEEVTPAPPSDVGGPPAEGAPDRLTFARWVTDARNPLTARVAVNRVWQMLFGRGLVATANDFGSQGAAPTHPELLDGLSVRFVDSGWDVKALVRLIVTSDAYRRTSIADADSYDADPENALLARGPSGRLPAESLRDAALSAGGLLVEQLGGPPVRPFQPPGLWQEKGAGAYRRQEGAGSHRRSLYTIWKRTSPPPSMMTFDAADREVCVMQRRATSTPLQALVLLNDTQYVEAACGLAERVGEGSLEERLTRLWRIATSRRPSAAELRVLRQLHDEQLAFFAADPDAAEGMLSAGDRQPSEATPESAAMAATALAVMNHDAFVTKR